MTASGPDDTLLTNSNSKKPLKQNFEDSDVYFQPLDYRAILCEICATDFKVNESVCAKSKEDFYTQKCLVKETCLKSKIAEQEMSKEERDKFTIIKKLVHIRKLVDG